MANGALIIPHVKKWEGYDKKKPSTLPGDAGGVTYKGITFNTWKYLAPKFNFNPSFTSFSAMTEQQWLKIFYWFWNSATNGNQIKNQSIANLLFESVWGGGKAIKKYQEFLKGMGANLKVNGIVDGFTTKAINEANQTILYNGMKKIWFNHITGHKYEKGLKNRFAELLKITPEEAGVSSVGFIGLLFITYLIIKS